MWDEYRQDHDIIDCGAQPSSLKWILLELRTVHVGFEYA